MEDNDRRARPGALVVDLLGDFNRTGGREMRLKALVALGEEIGVPGPTMRVTLARLRKLGWFDVSREGRESIYHFTATGINHLTKGGQRIHRPSDEPWSGDWSMVIYTVPESDRKTRDELRKQLVWLGFGPLASATWICPQPRLDDLANAAAGLPAARLTLLTTRTSGLAADRALAARCWDLDLLGTDYESFARSLRMRMPIFEQAALDGKAALIERIQLVHDYRNFARRDPHFPAELQPAGWPGDEVHRLYEKAHTVLAAHSQQQYAEFVKSV